MKPAAYQVHGALFTVNLIYAANYTIAKGLLPDVIGPHGFILLRITGALILLLIYHSLIIKERVKSLKDYGYIFICAVFGVGLNMLMFFKGLALTSPINSALIMVVTPILVIIIGFLTKLEKPTWLKVFGAILGTGAAAMLIISKNDKVGLGSQLGDLFIFINASSYAVFLILVRPLMQRYHPITVTLWTFIFGLFMVLP